MTDRHLWWQYGTIYQIYPRSLQDSNGDGIGDLPGIESRLDYLKWLGIDAIWLSPFYPSPMADFGYDVSNYTDVDPIFGTLADFERMLSAAHRKGLKVLIDFVPNHTSDQHPWFLQSRSSRDNPKRNWYIWLDPSPEGGPPNNWLSVFGGPAWTPDPQTGQYYYHAFLKEQPDLNWRNPEVRSAMHDVLRFWLDQGVDGFRVDVIYHLIKDSQFRDNPPNPEFASGMSPHHQLLTTYSADRPEVHEIIAGLRQVIDEYDQRMMVGEIYLPVDRLVTYYGAGGREIHMPFNFQLIRLPWHPAAIKEAIEKYEAALPPHGWPNWVLGNHDKHRIASRIGPEQARVAGMLLLTLRGTPTLYYGDEIGMQDVPIPPDRVQDPYEKNVPGLGLGRDPERTPMQWSAGPGAGFTRGTPWLPVATDADGGGSGVNVEAQANDPKSILSFYRRLIALRRSEKALMIGNYARLAANGNLLEYARSDDAGRTLLILLNLGHEPIAAAACCNDGRILLSTHLDRDAEPVHGHVDLRPDEALIIEIL